MSAQEARDDEVAGSIRGLDYWAQQEIDPEIRVVCARASEVIRYLRARKHPEPEITEENIRLATLHAVKKRARSDAEANRNYQEAERVIRAALPHLVGHPEPSPGPRWQFGEMNAMGGVWPIDPDISPELWASTPVERRRRRVAAGPWVPVGEGEQ